MILQCTCFFLTSAWVRSSQGDIGRFVLFLAFLGGLSRHWQRNLSDPKLAARQNKLPSTTCSLNTPNPRTPLSKIASTVQRQQIVMIQLSRACSVLLSLAERPDDRDASRWERLAATSFSMGSSTQTLLIDSNKGNESHLHLSSPAFSPHGLPYMPSRDIASLPPVSKCQKMGEPEQHLLKGKRDFDGVRFKRE